MIERKRYNGFFGRVRANYLLEKGLKFGIDCHGVHLKSTISTEVRQMVRFHLNKPGIPQTKEEVFFALVVAVLPSLDSETLLSVYQDADFHTGLGFVSAEVRSHLMSAIADLGPAQRSAINEYSKWVSDRNGRSVMEGGDS